MLVWLTADNINTDFGVDPQLRKNYVFYELHNSLGQAVNGIGCANVINNTIQNAGDWVYALKELCEETADCWKGLKIVWAIEKLIIDYL